MKISINVCFYLAIFYIADYNQLYLVCTEIKVFLNLNLLSISRPLIVVGGSCDTDQEAMGGFQEYPQVCV